MNQQTNGIINEETKIDRIPAKLILCFDGTGNKYSGDPSDTNVVKLYQKFNREAPNQYHYYQPGIGTYIAGEASLNAGILGRFTRWVSQTVDEGIGTTFDQHVIAGYRFIMRYYSDKDNIRDKIYIFGFSRGAFTARFLARMISEIGLLSMGNEEMVPFAYKAYQDSQMKSDETFEKKSKAFMTSFKTTFCRGDAKVHFLGLFDTVNSVATFDVPFTKNMGLPTVRETAHHVRHAVSIDERRAKFKAALLAQDKKAKDTRVATLLPKEEEDVKEVFFPGNHGDVGGGWAPSGKRTFNYVRRSDIGLDQEQHQHSEVSEADILDLCRTDILDLLKARDSKPKWIAKLDVLGLLKSEDSEWIAKLDDPKTPKDEMFDICQKALSDIKLKDPSLSKFAQERIKALNSPTHISDLCKEDFSEANDPVQLSDLALEWMITELDSLEEPKGKNETTEAAERRDAINKANKITWNYHKDIFLHNFYGKVEETITSPQHDMLIWGWGCSTWPKFLMWKLLELLPFRRLELRGHDHKGNEPQGNEFKKEEWVSEYWPPNDGKTRDIPNEVYFHPSVRARMDWRFVPLRNPTKWDWKLSSRKWMKRDRILLSNGNTIPYKPENTGICNDKPFTESNPSWIKNVWYKKHDDDAFLKALNLAGFDTTKKGTSTYVRTMDLATLAETDDGKHP